MSDRFGKFTRTQLLGQGGMGEVWKAWDGQLGRWVALKFLKGTGADDLARFQREAQIASRLNHPNIASIYEVGPNFIAMQFIEGTTLKKGRDVVRLISVAARAVHFAHEQKIIHRDLKPENLMVTPAGHLFVMDFGLARPTDGESDLSQSGLLVGTPAYMPPEQARGERVDARADVYSLGATLYELVTGRKLFAGASVLEILRKVVEDEPARAAGIDSDLETILLKCLEKERDRRYATAAALADDLDRYGAGEPIAARAPSVTYRIGKFARRRPGVVLFAAASLVAVGLIAGIGVPAFLRESKARQAADRALAKERDAAESLTELGRLRTQVLLARQGLYKQGENPRRVMEAIRTAVAEIGPYVERHPDQPQAFYVRAHGALYLNRLDEAEADLRAALRLNDDFSPGHALLARVLLGQVRRAWRPAPDTPKSEVLEVKKAAEAKIEEAQVHLRKGWGPGAAEDSMARWGLLKTAEDDVTDVMARAFRANYVDRDYDRCASILSEAHRARRSEEYCHFFGIVLPGEKERIVWQTRALEIMPHYAAAYEYRGLDHLELKNYPGALADLDACLAIDPDQTAALFNRAHVRFLMKNFDGAHDDVVRALELDPRRPKGLHFKAKVNMYRRKFDLAMKDLEKALELDPRYVGALTMQGTLLIETGAFAAALEAFNKALDIEADNPGVLGNRGVARASLGDFDGALADLSRAIELLPLDPDGYVNRGKLFDTAGKAREAEADYRKALELQSPTWPYRRVLEDRIRKLSGQPR